ncbi:MAG: hypothetical protein JXD18_01925 [Anaerolineae bacterium]|nr:hypothetical protein [Anaerolineae bacterium]
MDRIETELEGRAEVVRLSVMSDVGGTLARRYGVRGVPTLVVIDGAGQVVYAEAGIPDQEAIIAAVEGVLNP